MLTAGGVVEEGVVAGAAFFAALFFFAFFTAAGFMVLSLAAGAGVVVVGVVCAKEIPARARIMEKEAMVFIVVSGFSFLEALFSYRLC